MTTAVKRMRGLAIHRSILIGNTATPLSEAERHLYPPDHTHKWTVAVRSAATNPLPNIPTVEQQHQQQQQQQQHALGSTPAGPAAVAQSVIGGRGRSTTPASGSRTGTPAPASGGQAGDSGRTAGSATPLQTGMSTRGREHETDYHKMVGGKDDISHFIKRVQFKLHETYPQATRNIDKPPFQVTETGWGEFDIQIKIFFVPESGEKPVATFHRLKLHPWHPVAVPAPEAPLSIAAGDVSQTADTTGGATLPRTDAGGDGGAAGTATAAEPTTVKAEEGITSGTPAAASVHETRAQSAAALPSAPARPLAPVVHSWAYDEVVFPEPPEVFYETLITHPPTPLPALSAQAYGDPTAFRMYRASLDQLDQTSGPSGRDMHAEAGIRPPHPLHDASGALFDALSQEAVLAEGERLDKARYSAVRELEETRSRLIEGEKKLREIRPRLAGTA